MEEKTHWKKAFNSDYLSSADIVDEIVLTIASVKLEEVKGADGKAKTCNVAHFKESKYKPMVLNVTNSKVVKKFAKSKFIEDWKNVPVQIYVDDNVRAFGEVTEGLRIRTEQPRVTKPELKPDTEQWDKAVQFLKDGGKIEQITNKYVVSKENCSRLTT